MFLERKAQVYIFLHLCITEDFIHRLKYFEKNLNKRKIKYFRSKNLKFVLKY